MSDRTFAIWRPSLVESSTTVSHLVHPSFTSVTGAALEDYFFPELPGEGSQNLRWPDAKSTPLSRIIPAREEEIPNDDIADSNRSGQDPPAGLIEVLRRVELASGEEKHAARREAAEIISSRQLRDLDVSIERLISTRGVNRLDNATDLLVELSPPSLETFAADKLRAAPPSAENADVWYVILRALGRLGSTTLVHEIAHSPCRDQLPAAVCEALAVALSDLGDNRSLALLKAMAETNPFVAEIVTELSSERAE